jgi:hypothetical protein
VDLEHNIGFITLLYLPCTDTAEEKSLCSEDNEGGRSCKSNASLNSTNSETEISNDNSAFEDEVDFNDWSLYDLQFGIPLFERSINQTILKKVSEENLFSAENLKRLSNSSRQLSLRLLDFIYKKTKSKEDQLTFDSEFPVSCWYFSNGKLEICEEQEFMFL